MCWLRKPTVVDFVESVNESIMYIVGRVCNFKRIR